MHTNTTETEHSTTDLIINDTITHTENNHKPFCSEEPQFEDVETSLLSFFTSELPSAFPPSAPLFIDEDTRASYSPVVIKPRIASRSEPQILQQPLEVNAPGTPVIRDENSQSGESGFVVSDECMVFVFS